MGMCVRLCRKDEAFFCGLYLFLGVHEKYLPQIVLELLTSTAVSVRS
jgi:hypothetical protein